jgi:hypothetical protein
VINFSFAEVRPFAISDEAYNIKKDNKTGYGLPSGHCLRFIGILTYISLSLWFNETYNISKIIKVLITLFGIFEGIILIHIR